MTEPIWTELVWIDKRDALAIHEQSLIRHGGAGGIRDENLLESALARPLQHHHYGESSSVIELAAIYCSGIVRNHPFVDGNKPTGFIVSVLCLEMNGYIFSASEAEAAQAVLELAAGTVEEAGFAEFLRDHTKAKPSTPRKKKS